MRISRDRGLAAYAYTMLDLGVAAAMTRSRDRWARRLAAATLSKGGGAPAGALGNKAASAVLTNKSGSIILTRKAA